MSDWLLLGVDPRDEVGKEFYTHTMEEWCDIVSFVDAVLGPVFRLNPDAPLEYLEDRDALRLARRIDDSLSDSGIIRYVKRCRWYQPGEDVIETLRRFSVFLKSCGGFLTELGSG